MQHDTIAARMKADFRRIFCGGPPAPIPGGAQIKGKPNAILQCLATAEELREGEQS